MPFPWLAAAGAFGSITSALGLRKQQKLSQTMAQTQMDFQERMSSTSHQREVTDLRTAGLNPILSATRGASTPGGAMGQAQNVGGGAAQGAINTAMAAAQIKNVTAQTGLTEAQTAAIQPISKTGEAVSELIQFLKEKGAGTAKQLQEWTDEFYRSRSKITQRTTQPMPMGELRPTR